MKLGLFTPVFQKQSFPEMLASLRQWPEITMLEIGTGGWPGGQHLDRSALLGNREAIPRSHNGMTGCFGRQWSWRNRGKFRWW